MKYLITDAWHKLERISILISTPLGLVHPVEYKQDQGKKFEI
jgi:hypothetical protein